ncbi:MAG TPA: rod shape-determining protein MreC [Chlamydiales bacterium]|nr:rod shape-determining protein MreC [Chlamydiales bacterium]
MRKGLSPFYITLAALLFCWINIPLHISDQLRSFSVASLGPVWDGARGIKKYLPGRPTFASLHKNEKEIAQLELENAMLRSQIERISQWLGDEKRILEQLTLYEKFKTEATDKPFFERRARHLQNILQSELMAMPAEVIYRDPSSWGSSLWVNVGEEDNQVLGKQVIAKNSPVVSGCALVGVVDYVGNRQSRVRLISDSGLSPAVRAIRGSIRNEEILSKMSALIELLPDKESLVSQLQEVRSELENKEAYLAKGELHGSSSPLWRARSSSLKGIGFNFDYVDEEGSAPKKIALLKKGDLLVTTGFDGVFPPDLRVGIVKYVKEPKPGGFSYEIEVHPIIDTMSDLDALFVLPPRAD